MSHTSQQQDDVRSVITTLPRSLNECIATLKREDLRSNAIEPLYMHREWMNRILENSTKDLLTYSSAVEYIYDRILTVRQEHGLETSWNVRKPSSNQTSLDDLRTQLESFLSAVYAEPQDTRILSTTSATSLHVEAYLFTLYVWTLLLIDDHVKNDIARLYILIARKDTQAIRDLKAFYFRGWNGRVFLNDMFKTIARRMFTSGIIKQLITHFDPDVFIALSFDDRHWLGKDRNEDTIMNDKGDTLMHAFVRHALVEPGAVVDRLRLLNLYRSDIGCEFGVRNNANETPLDVLWTNASFSVITDSLTEILLSVICAMIKQDLEEMCSEEIVQVMSHGLGYRWRERVSTLVRTSAEEDTQSDNSNTDSHQADSDTSSDDIGDDDSDSHGGTIEREQKKRKACERRIGVVERSLRRERNRRERLEHQMVFNRVKDEWRMVTLARGLP